MSELHRITVNPEQSGGRPSIRGLRVRVKDVLELLAAGVSREEILADYPYLEDGDITAVLEYAAQQSDHPVSARTERWRCGFWSCAAAAAQARWLAERGHTAEHLFDLGWPVLTTGMSGRTPASDWEQSSSRRTRILLNVVRARAMVRRLSGFASAIRAAVTC